MKSADADLIAVGRIVKAFGIKGEVIIEVMTDAPDRLTTLKRVSLVRWDSTTGRAREPGIPSRVIRAHVEPRGARVMLQGISDRTAAERSVGMLLMIDKEERTPLPEGGQYVHDLIGMRVVSEAGDMLGTVADILRLPAHDVYVVRDGDREWMIPAVSAFVHEVNAATRTITVSLIEGMRE